MLSGKLYKVLIFIGMCCFISISTNVKNRKMCFIHTYFQKITKILVLREKCNGNLIPCGANDLCNKPNKL
jgi:hypothetical protein